MPFILYSPDMYDVDGLENLTTLDTVLYGYRFPSELIN